jgi:hypothetical protein
VSELDPAKVALHNQQVAEGLLPSDAPADFVLPEGGVNDAGLPWWFPPDFKPYEVTIAGRRAESLRAPDSEPPERTPDGLPIHLALNYFEHEDPPLVTRASIESNFSYRITELSKPAAVLSPTRIWSEQQMARIRLGYESQAMEERWHGFIEGDELFMARSWTGILIYRATFVPAPGGWRIDQALGESDLDLYLRGTDSYEEANMESVIVGAVLGKYDPALDERWSKEMARSDRGPRLVITKAKSHPISVENPGQSVKHGKLADQHPLQRAAYDAAVEKGREAALSALNKGRTTQDIYYAAHRHEERALMTIGIESSQHAGLAKGAKTAAFEYSQRTLFA